MVEKKPEIHFEPGERWEYSDTGYVLLATIAERASGMSFQDFMQDRVFGPVGMTDTSVYEYVKGPDTKMPLRVFGYSGGAGPTYRERYPFPELCQGRWWHILHIGRSPKMGQGPLYRAACYQGHP